MNIQLTIAALLFLAISSCSDSLVEGQNLTSVQTDVNPSTNSTQGTGSETCTDVANMDVSRGSCTETLPYTSEVVMTVSGNTRSITANGIPGHMVGLFGNVSGSLNPNAISEQNARYSMTANPEKSSSITYLFDPASGPKYVFGITLNGVEIDPEAAEPWPHTRPVNFNTANWEWNLDAMSINLGLDCNNAHVQPTGKYHYHGAPTLFLDQLDASAASMTLIGYAADGFPLYYKYGYADDSGTNLQILTSSYRLKTGERPGDGSSAPCGSYTGIYTADYEYVPGLGDLDECNGREGVTPEYPQGTYYYMITDAYPYVGRCLVGSPSSDFRLR